jgi:hypothetical protein
MRRSMLDVDVQCGAKFLKSDVEVAQLAARFKKVSSNPRVTAHRDLCDCIATA